MTVFAFDQGLTPGAQSAIVGPFFAQVDGANYPRRCFHYYRGVPLLHDKTYMQRFATPARAGTIGGGAQREFATGISINTSIEHQGKLWMGGYTTGSVVNWDGSLVLTEASVGTAPLVMAVFQETLLAFGTNTCKKRNLDGTWSAVSMPGGITSFVPRAAVQYLNNLYIGGFDNATALTGKILKYDGSTLTDVHSVSGSTDSNDVGCTDLALFGGKLLYAHNDVATSTCKIGQFDGSNWIDTKKDLAAQIGGSPTIGCLAPYRGSLYVGLGIKGGGHLYRSPGSAVDGTYTLVTSSFTGLYDMIFVVA